MVSVADLLFYFLVAFVLIWASAMVYYMRQLCQFAKARSHGRPITQQDVPNDR